MLHITLSSIGTCTAICLLYALVVLALLQFGKAAKLKPDPPTNSSTVLVELTMSTRSPEDAYSQNNTMPSVIQTFTFADDIAKAVTAFLAGFNPPSLSDIDDFLNSSDGLIADLIIAPYNNDKGRQMTLLGSNAEKVVSFLTYCFDYQLASETKETHSAHVSLTA